MDLRSMRTWPVYINLTSPSSVSPSTGTMRTGTDRLANNDGPLPAMDGDDAVEVDEKKAELAELLLLHEDSDRGRCLLHWPSCSG